MKKRSFFSGLTATMALATVALTTVTLTSCEKESFSVTPSTTTPEITVTPSITVDGGYTPADASALITITVIDWSNGQVLATGYQPIAATDGTIAMQQITVSCPEFDGQDNYLDVEDITVWIPALGKGQAAVIPVTFYAQSLESVATSGKTEVVAGDESKKTEGEETEATEIADDVKVSTEDRTNVVIENVVYQSGQEVTNIDEVNAYIDALFPETKAYTNAQKKNILKALVATYNTGIKPAVGSVTINSVPANNEISVKVVTTYETVEQILEHSIDDEVYRIPLMIKRVTSSKAEVTLTDVSHSHGHGDDANAGGGAAGK
jgi:hypothetical protein